jgi:GH24 family phage-related lysozyme (muramidase)
MIKLTDIINEITNAVPPAPIAHIQPAATNIFSGDFIDYMKTVENGIKKGFDSRTNMWYPHKSFEGGIPTIAYGHKIKNKIELKTLKKGISDDAALNLLKHDLLLANKNVHEYVKKVYKVNLMLNEKQEQMLTDFAYNVGLEKFPKFVDAVIREDINKMKKEYKRYSSGQELADRNKRFFDTFLK